MGQWVRRSVGRWVSESLKAPDLPVCGGPASDLVSDLLSGQMVLLVKEQPVLVDAAALEKCYRVMDLLCEQCVKQEDMNEVLALKMHYISCVLQKCLASLRKRDHQLDQLVQM